MKTAYLSTPIGTLELQGDEKGLVSLSFIDASESNTTAIPEVLQPVASQLREYFEGKRTQFDLKLSPEGSDFQKKVWNALQTIPYGKTTSYQDMANALGNPKVIRAAAAANGKNPIAIIVPCHRVIGTDGSLTGYAGGLHRKKWLLKHESPVKQGVLF
ncbi:MAG: methylated-DNA--[protein]-cysteine S-methyltransferase [Flavobacteriales bacterium]|jgi:methylated-DNA-[protein]-cysteine S-methyltransferase|nr:methylated-DNA--[protein]-cysteine S-methyltransferase [Flavobacteriales bacterium]